MAAHASSSRSLLERDSALDPHSQLMLDSHPASTPHPGTSQHGPGSTQQGGGGHQPPLNATARLHALLAHWTERAHPVWDIQCEGKCLGVVGVMVMVHDVERRWLLRDLIYTRYRPKGARPSCS
jgi:hypothetical protein